MGATGHWGGTGHLRATQAAGGSDGEEELGGADGRGGLGRAGRTQHREWLGAERDEVEMGCAAEQPLLGVRLLTQGPGRGLLP